MTDGSEDYPSWLPKRPDPPAPASTLRSYTSILEPSSPGLSEPMSPVIQGQKPASRSIRIVSVEGDNVLDRDQRQATDRTRVASSLYPRIWSRGATPVLSPTVAVNTPPPLARLPQPRFRSRDVNLEILSNPSLLSHIYFYLFPILTLAHIPLQTFLDFNSAFMLVQVSKFPAPEAPNVPGSGRNWALGVAAYVACWLIWIIIVFVVYELIYSFIRKWRTKRPSIFPIYTSTPARDLASMTSYTTFSFLLHVRFSAFISTRSGSIRDGLAETFYFYSQNLPTVALLLPRAGLCLALLLTFSTADPNVVTLTNEGSGLGRDGTFFNRDGTLTAYASGVLMANVAWTLWRTLVLLISWIGLWTLSGHACAGLCGPRYRWEEEDLHEKNRSSLYALGGKDSEAAYYDPDGPLPWSWKEGTQMRIWDAYTVCYTGRYSGRRAPQLPYPESPGPFEGIETLMTTVGLDPPSSTSPQPQQQHKRGALSADLYRRPDQPVASGSRVKSSPPLGGSPLDLTAIIPRVVRRMSRGGGSAPQTPEGERPLEKLPYPFTSRGAARLSSIDVEAAKKLPFPPSPSLKTATKSSSSKGGSKSGTGAVHGHEEEEEEEEEQDELTETEDTGRRTSSGGDPSSSSSTRPSTSLSSLGRPIPSRYPFQFHFRQPSASGSTPPSNGRSIGSQQTHSTQMSRSTVSTGNYDSTDYSPRSPYNYDTTSSDAASPVSLPGARGVIPMPPTTTSGRARARAGTVPAPSGVGSSSSSSSPSVDFRRHSGRQRARTRGDSAGRFAEIFSGRLSGSGGGAYGMSSPEPGLYSSDIEREDEDEESMMMMMEQPEPEGSQEEEEGDDVVALLSSSRAQSPRTSLRQRTNSAASSSPRNRSSLGGGGGSGSRSGSDSRTHSVHSGSSSGRSRAGSMTGVVRSRTQSLLQTVNSASRSSLEMVMRSRSRANSLTMARLEDEYVSDSRTHSRSGSASDAGGENNTFGFPVDRRSVWDQRRREGPDTLSEEERESVHDVPVPPSSYDPRPSLREARSDLSGNAPSLPPSESTVHGDTISHLHPSTAEPTETSSPL
ncbi:hypothetical protein L218DRAFT_995968 [Marasmius fiardii PR-910]|nr:hypothetical protein L218DRAFT_995968 [Marasmius fiardii PR-910]